MNSRSVRLLPFSAALLAALCSDVSAAALDSSFGNDGRVAVELGIFGSRANAVAVQPDGKIVAAGYASSSADRDFMLFRLLSDGSLDPEFNHDGTVTTAVGSFDDEALAVAVQPDGKIVAAGYSGNGGNRDFALVRYNSDGSLDRSFGTEGMAVTAVGGSHDEITDIALQEDGGIILAGSAAQDAGGKVAVLARYLADGSPDTSFADEGFSLSAVGVDSQAESVALGKDGRILLSGSYSDGQRRGLMLLGFDSQGRLDKDFGKNGIAVPAGSAVFSEGYGMIVSKDGTILAAGSVGENGRRDAALFRFTADGSPDSGFEKQGALVMSVGSGDDVLHDVVVTGKTIAASGFKADEEQREFLLVTYSKSAGDAEENSGSLTMQTSAAAVTTGFGGSSEVSTALAAVPGQSVVAVGESEAAAGSSAVVSKYTMAAGDSSSAAVSAAGSEYVRTGAPYEVTRTTAVIPAEVRGLSGTVSKRGIVFGSTPYPSLKDGSASNDGSGAPAVTNNSPTSVTGASVTLSLTTDVNASCKYDSSAGTAYDDMENSFSTTGEKTHSQTVADLEAGKTYTYYGRCKNKTSGAVNTSDTVISFTVSSGSSSNDRTAPTVTNKTKQHFLNNESVSLAVTTNEKATCRYNEDEDAAYDEMTLSFSASTDGKTHAAALGSNLNEGTHAYYARCKDAAENKNSSGTKIEFEVHDDTGPERSELGPSGTLSTSSTTLQVTTDVAAECRYATTAGTAYASMNDIFSASADGTKHTKSISGLSGGLSEKEYRFYVKCKNNSTGTANQEDAEIFFTVAGIAPPPITSSGASDKIINTALRNVGGFFVGTAVAQTGTPDTTQSTSATTATSTAGSTSSSTSSASTATEFLEEGSTSEGGGNGAFSSKLTNLKPSTFFYARAYAVSGGVTYYGNEVSFRTADSCFVATAAYGSLFHPAVQVLRDFRNQFLNSSPVSRAAVKLYYQVSPALADLISQHSGLRMATRLLLLPVTGAAWLMLQSGLWTLLVPAAVGMLLLTYGGRRMKRRQA